MKANKSAVLSLEMSSVRALRMGSSGVETLRSLAGTGSRALGHDLTPEYAFLACDCSSGYAGVLRALVRSFVWLPGPGALVDCDIAVTGDAPVSVNWKLEGMPRPATVARILPRPGKLATTGDILFLNAIWTGEPRPIAPIDSTDLAGLRIADRVVAFYVESHTARSAVSFDVDGAGALKFLVTGLAPGDWEIWSGGMLDIPEAEVRPETGALRFEGRPGSYFLRRLGS